MESIEANEDILHKWDIILVEIFKKEWPNNWTSFVKDLVNSALESESRCRNCIFLLKLVVEDVFPSSFFKTPGFPIQRIHADISVYSWNPHGSAEWYGRGVPGTIAPLVDYVVMHASVSEYWSEEFVVGYHQYYPFDYQISSWGMCFWLPIGRRADQVRDPSRLPNSCDDLFTWDSLSS